MMATTAAATTKFLFCFLLLVAATSVRDAFAEQQPLPSESECRPYIERALKNLESVSEGASLEITDEPYSNERSPPTRSGRLRIDDDDDEPTADSAELRTDRSEQDQSPEEADQSEQDDDDNTQEAKESGEVEEADDSEIENAQQSEEEKPEDSAEERTEDSEEETTEDSKERGKDSGEENGQSVEDDVDKSGEEDADESVEDNVEKSGEEDVLESADDSGEKNVNESGEDTVEDSGEEKAIDSGEENVEESGEKRSDNSREENVEESEEDETEKSEEEQIDDSGEQESKEISQDSGDEKTEESNEDKAEGSEEGEAEESGEEKVTDSIEENAEDSEEEKAEESGEEKVEDSGEDRITDSGEETTEDSGEDKTAESGEKKTEDSEEDKATESAEENTDDSEEEKAKDSGEGEAEDSGEDKTTDSGEDKTEDSGEDQTAESKEEKAEDSVEDQTAESKEETAEDSGEDKTADSEEEKTEDSEEGETEDSEENEVNESEEVTPEEDLLLEMDIPENLRSREHIAQILRLDEESTEAEMLLEKSSDIILRELKRLDDNAIKPLELLYKYRDLSNRHFGDPEIFSKPLVLFMGPWSGGKSSLINYLTDNEFTEWSLRTGAEPSPAYFNILMYGSEPQVLDGTQLAADWTFSGLQKFGQGLEERLRGLKLPNKLLQRVNIVEIPGILEVRKQVSRVFPFNDACQWFIDRADVIFLVYDPSKLDVGPETEAILDQLKGRESQTRIILNKADQVKPEELMRVQSALIWNISPLMSSAQPPIMYTTSLWSIPYEEGAPVRLLQAQEKAFLRDLRTAIDRRVENKIASARRFAVRVRNHAKMVDCYLTTYYNHKTIFGNKKLVAEAIIEHPQNYHIYEGLSTLTNISRYDLPDPETYRDFFRLNPLYEFQQLSATCTYFRGCPINKLDVAIAYDLPELTGKFKKMVETVTPQGMPKS